MSFTIQLHNLRFFAGHGIYEEEQSVGNEFELNISMDIEAPDEVITNIHETINYASVYEIAKRIFSDQKPLLETLAMEIAKAIKEEFQLLQRIQVQIIKLHPPITGFIGSVSVTYNKEFR